VHNTVLTNSVILGPAQVKSCTYIMIVTISVINLGFHADWSLIASLSVAWCMHNTV